MGQPLNWIRVFFSKEEQAQVFQWLSALVFYAQPYGYADFWLDALKTDSVLKYATHTMWSEVFSVFYQSEKYKDKVHYCHLKVLVMSTLWNHKAKRLCKKMKTINGNTKVKNYRILLRRNHKIMKRYHLLEVQRTHTLWNQLLNRLHQTMLQRG